MSVERERLEVTREVLRALSHRDFRSELASVTGRDGEHPVVVALPHDTVRDVFERVYEHGDAHVAITDKHDALRLLAMSATEEVPAGSEPVEIHPDETMDMLLVALDQFPGMVTFIEVEPDLHMQLRQQNGPEPAAASC